ncbi:hypothetical protein Ct61P_10386 [Colletotrichum tofieldiae]|nr:hypothetical protein Ct61P_10386 [Colletotrichum tofieldiae]
MALGGARLAAKKQTKRMNATFKYTTRDPTWIEIINKGGMTSGALAVVRKTVVILPGDGDIPVVLLSPKPTGHMPVDTSALIPAHPRVPTRTNPRRGRSWAHCGRGAAVMAGVYSAFGLLVHFPSASRCSETKKPAHGDR